MIDQTCTQWLEQLASSAPAPGGGGAAALMGAIGVSLGAMVGSLTVGKKKYADVEEEVSDLTQKAKDLSLRLQAMVLADEEAFLPLAAAYGMPVATEEEKAVKEAALQDALIGATEVPLEILMLCVQALELIEQFARKGSRLAVSDAGCAAACCRAAMESAKLNVYINLKLMRDGQKRQEYQSQMDRAFQRGQALAGAIYDTVEQELRP